MSETNLAKELALDSKETQPMASVVIEGSSVGADIRALRKGRGLTLEALAEELDKSVGFLSQQSAVSRRLLLLICVLLPNYLISPYPSS